MGDTGRMFDAVVAASASRVAGPILADDIEAQPVEMGLRGLELGLRAVGISSWVGPGRYPVDAWEYARIARGLLAMGHGLRSVARALSGVR